ncbi:spore germination protein [Terribacillus halophilus]|uniref:Spore germination protein n=1 Tax=Terribacillus halophilus TaxID=361279 RepID=A0A1G6MZC0_9BACI|nr:spore germination protein [Terribacillus halophilus]SDC60316.1 spore germination protein [Terribacillus halophilus]
MGEILQFLGRTDVWLGTIVVVLIPIGLTLLTDKVKKLREKQHTRIEQQFIPENHVLSAKLSVNVNQLKAIVGDSSDIIFRQFKLGMDNRSCSIVHIDGLVDQQQLQQSILHSLMHAKQMKSGLNPFKSESIKDYLLHHVLEVSDVTVIKDMKKIVRQLLSGSVLLFVDGLDEVVVLSVKKWLSRNLDEPITEALVRGPRMSFIENLRDNTAMLRRMTTDANLTFADFEIGKRTSRQLTVAYVKDIANEELLNNVKERIENLDIDHAAESGYIEQLIEDDYMSIFPQVQATERPDRVMGAILEGRIAILLDGTSYALLVPATFSMMLQSPEDYYERWIPMSLIRLLRYVAAFLSIFLPSFYIAFVSFHQGLIPTDLALAIAGTRVGVPFPTIIEALLMEVSIELLREAGLRLPRPVGQTVGLVGALIIGEAAVQAGLVSPIMVIVVAATAIASFVSPHYGAGIAQRALRFLAMFSAAFLGLYGISLFFLSLCVHAVKLRSFGVPYVTPGTLYSKDDWKDFFLRMPLFTMRKRPAEYFPKDQVRRKKY